MSMKMTGRVQQGSNQLPDYSLKGPVKYIFEEADCNNRLKHIKKGPIGFDTEFYGTPTRTPIYVPGKYNWEHGKLCVIQVAVEGQVYVIHIKRMRAIPAELIRILKSVDIVKVGVDFANDGKVLYELFGIPMNNFKDVGLMVKYANAHKYPDKDQGPLSMEQCVQDILHAHLDKALQTSDWRAHELSNEQIKYAALDAQAALEVFKIAQHSLQRRGHILKINIPSFWYSHDIRATTFESNCNLDKAVARKIDTGGKSYLLPTRRARRRGLAGKAGSRTLTMSRLIERNEGCVVMFTQMSVQIVNFQLKATEGGCHRADNTKYSCIVASNIWDNKAQMCDGPLVGAGMSNGRSVAKERTSNLGCRLINDVKAVARDPSGIL
ncbi:ribonuclease H-like domain-containing protein [Mycena galopus ATCC 62051]|nr:ribonuclease H-like domain-containing protein [Mycena galopus ATCC 62051]